MSNIDVLAMSISNTYTDDSIKGYGVQAGKNCQIISKTAITGGTRITFGYYDDDEVKRQTTMDVMDGQQGEQGSDGEDGVGIVDFRVEGTNLICIMSNGTESDPIPIPTVKGDAGKDGKDGLGVPSGGTTGQVLRKKSNADNDTEWADGGSGGDAVLSNDLTTAIAVGGINAGTEYEKDTPLEDILRDMLEPTLYPSFTNPSASLTYGSSTYYAVGGTVNAMTATVSLNRGSINPAYTTDGYRAGASTGFAISTSGADTEYSASSENSGSFSVPALTRATKGTIVVTGTASYAQGAQPKDSKGNNYNSPLPAGSVTATKTITFIQPYYYGASDSNTIADFTGLTANVTSKGQKTFNFTTNNQYMVFAYDSSYGNLKTILDGNGFDVTDGWSKSTVTVGGFSYYVYVSNSPTTDTNAPFTFKY